LFWVQDCSAAAENILIAATSLGLGSVWIGIYPVRSFMKIVSKILFIPERVTPLCVVYVGYPAEAKSSRTRYIESRVYWQRYQQRKKQVGVKDTQHMP
jgi:nitroreductase